MKETNANEFDHKTAQDKTSGNHFSAVCFVLLEANSQNQIIRREQTRFF